MRARMRYIYVGIILCNVATDIVFRDIFTGHLYVIIHTQSSNLENKNVNTHSVLRYYIRLRLPIGHYAKENYNTASDDKSFWFERVTINEYNAINSGQRDERLVQVHSSNVKNNAIRRFR